MNALRTCFLKRHVYFSDFKSKKNKNKFKKNNFKLLQLDTSSNKHIYKPSSKKSWDAVWNVNAMICKSLKTIFYLQ